MFPFIDRYEWQTATLKNHDSHPLEPLLRCHGNKAVSRVAASLQFMSSLSAPGLFISPRVIVTEGKLGSTCL